MQCGMPLQQPAVPLHKTSIMSKVLEQGPDIKRPSIPPKKSGEVLTTFFFYLDSVSKKKDKELRVKMHTKYKILFNTMLIVKGDL